MQVSHEQLVSYLRSIHSRPGGTGAVFNMIRASEVRGAADIAALTDLVSNPALRLDLARHGADEARHAYLLERRMGELGFPSFRLAPELDRVERLLERSRARDVKQVYAERGRVGDAELMEFIVAVYLAEKDAIGKIRANHEALAGDPKSQSVLGTILKDEERHVAYLASWTGWFEKRFSRRAVRAAAARLEDVLADVAFVYYGALQEYFDRAADRSLAA
jgi:hypothetical protein